MDQAIVFERMGRQGISSFSAFSDVASLVGWMGCVQAQDFAMGKWGLGMRLGARFDDGPGHGAAAGAGSGVSPVFANGPGSDSAIEAAFDSGAILRTHVLRPTWHFILPADITWMVRLSAPRIRAFSQLYYRQLELGPAVFRRSRKVIEKALAGGAFLTRAEFVPLFKQAKIDTTDIRMNFLMMDAELEGLICSGPRQGKQFTYALLADRVAGDSLSFAGDEALGELARRYFASRGPATLADFAWWAGLTLGDAKRGMEVGRLSPSSAGLLSSAMLPSPVRDPVSPRVLLLPAFDELAVAYKDRSAILPAAYEKASSSGLKPVVVVDGRIVGVWRRTLGKGKVVVEVQLLEKVSLTVRRLIGKEVERFGRFLGVGVASFRMNKVI